MRNLFCISILSCVLTVCCQVPETQQVVDEIKEKKVIQVGAERVDLYLDYLKDKRVAVVANPSSMIDTVHLVDSLLALHVNLVKIFALEHGFRGKQGAGQPVINGKDPKTGLPVYSLYGKTVKPSPKLLSDVDVVVYDIQDVGVRFYTYISSLHYIMEAVGENNKELLVLDRPNPNGFYVDGPVLDIKHRSFVGMDRVPVVYGLTTGEYAQMLNGEKWLENGVQCSVKIIPCANYTHKDFYSLPVKPSPNLPNDKAIFLYPSLCFFEGTPVSAGRGTDIPFQLYGYPNNPNGDFEFTPHPNEGAKHPKFEGEKCTGFNLSNLPDSVYKSGKLNLQYLLSVYQFYKDKKVFFTSFFDKLAGSEKLREQIEAGKTVQEIRASWQKDLNQFKEIRKKYLLYEDF